MLCVVVMTEIGELGGMERGRGDGVGGDGGGEDMDYGI